MDLWEQVVRFENLRQAARRASKGKLKRASVARFLERLEPNLLRLQRDLTASAYLPGAPRQFLIHDPKTRLISAAPFRDRVVHHALIGPLEPIFERHMLPHSFACRKGKGTHAALDHAQKMIRKFEWFQRFDIAACFDSIRHDVVMDAVGRCVRAPKILALFRSVIEAGGQAGKGLPIGSLTSQWSANLVLNRLDHFVFENLKCRGYVRYMDDFVLYGRSKEELRELRERLVLYLSSELSLAAKQRAMQLGRSSDGLPFLGWRLYPRLRRVRPESLRRIRRRLLKSKARIARGASEEHESPRVRACIEHLRSGSARPKVRGLVAHPRTV